MEIFDIQCKRAAAIRQQQYRSNKVNSVFYADSYHPIQSGSIDCTDIVSHDNAVYRALLCSSVGLYDRFGDPKIIGDPYATLFVGRLNELTNEDSLRKVTGASCGYAFVEFESGREMRRAYQDAHHSIIDDSKVIVDYNRQQLMPGSWRRPIPYDDLKILGIPPPPEGRYLTCFEVPSSPRRPRSSMDREEHSRSHKRHKRSRHSYRYEGRMSSSKDHLSD